MRTFANTITENKVNKVVNSSIINPTIYDAPLSATRRKILIKSPVRANAAKRKRQNSSSPDSLITELSLNNENPPPAPIYLLRLSRFWYPYICVPSSIRNTYICTCTRRDIARSHIAIKGQIEVHISARKRGVRERKAAFRTKTRALAYISANTSVGPPLQERLTERYVCICISEHESARERQR